MGGELHQCGRNGSYSCWTKVRHLDCSFANRYVDGYIELKEKITIFLPVGK